MDERIVYIRDHGFWSRRTKEGRHVLFRDAPLIYVNAETSEQATSLAVSAINEYSKLTRSRMSA